MEISNETVIVVLAFLMLCYSLYIGASIYVVAKKLERIEQILAFWKRNYELRPVLLNMKSAKEAGNEEKYKDKVVMPPLLVRQWKT